MTRDDFRVDVAADPRLLSAVRALVRSYVMACGMPKGRVDDVVLAVDEACTNSIRHAYGGPCDKRLHLALRTDGQAIEVELTDRGKPAPKERIERRPLEPPDPSTITPGGLGVQLMYEVFDEVEFRPGTRQGNVLRLRLNVPKPPA